jgi:hypothetical protein
VTTLPVLVAPASIMGRSSHGGYATGLRPFALPRPDALSPPPSRPLVCAYTTNNARRYGHPLADGPGPIGAGLYELPRIPFRRNTNVPLCRALRLSVAYCGSLLTGAGIKLGY